MKQPPKKTGENFFKRHIGFLGAFVCFTIVVFSIIFITGMTAPAAHPLGRVFIFAWLYAIGWALALTLLIASIRWVWCGNVKRFLFCLACFITLIALFYIEEDMRGYLAWHSYKHQLEAKGEKLDFSDFVPPQIPDDQNFAMTPIVVTSYGNLLTSDGKVIPFNQRDKNYDNRMAIHLTDDINNNNMPEGRMGDWQTARMSDLSSWQSYYRALAAKTNDFPVSPTAQAPAADVLLALSKYDSAIEELRQAAQLPDSRFPLNYGNNNPAEILLPHLAAIKQCTQVLQLRALAELQNNQSDKALNDVKLILRLAESIRNEPFIITHLVRIAGVQMVLQPVYEGLANHQWSDAQLAELDSELAKLDFLADFKQSVGGERASAIRIVAWLQHNPGRFREFWGSADEGPGMDVTPLSLFPAGWFYQNDIGFVKLDELWMGIVDDGQQIVSPHIASQALNTFVRSLRHTGPYNVLTRILAPQLDNFARRIAVAQNAVNMARIAIALERYHLVNGDYPGSLDALSPHFLQDVPHDIIIGDPLHYRPTQDGQFILYSVGWNERDDGGIVALRKTANNRATGNIDLTSGDWVWRYPAK
jgi:hypothetical protein